MARSRAHQTVAALCILSIALAAGVSADGASSVRAGVSTSCKDTVKARKFNDDLFEVGVFFPEGFVPENIFCSFSAKNPAAGTQNNGQRGIKGNATARVLNQFGSTIGTFNQSIKTDGKGYDRFEILPLSGAAALTVGWNVKGSKKMNQGNLNCFGSNVPPCEPGATTLCLNDGRFQVDVDWRDFDNSTGSGMVLRRENDQGSFYFFNPNNTNLLVQLLEACGNNDHFWVFASANTNVEYDLTVTDTATGVSRVYGNPLGQVAQAITDTSAFATCP